MEKKLLKHFDLHLYMMLVYNTPLKILRVNGSFAAEKGGNGSVISFF
jgi:hypothetical protein